MTRVALFVVALVACDKTDAPNIAERFVDHVSARDRNELIEVKGTVQHVRVHGKHDEPHLSFELEHDGQRMTVVFKGVVPIAFREGVFAKVRGRWVMVSRAIREDLDREDFTEVGAPDVLLARDVLATGVEF